MNDANPKSFLSCSEVARRLGLSRQRFWQLRKEGVFPQPQEDAQTGRLFYTEQQFEVCMDLRRRNVGMNGRIVLFYSPRPSVAAPRAPRKKAAGGKTQPQHSFLLAGLRALGLSEISPLEIDRRTKALFPNGIEGVDQGEVVRAIFLAIKRQDSNDNV